MIGKQASRWKRKLRLLYLRFFGGPRASFEDVVNLYRVLLGRNPESEAVVRLRAGRPVLRLVRDIVASEEFRVAVLEPMRAGAFPRCRLTRTGSAEAARWAKALARRFRRKAKPEDTGSLRDDHPLAALLALVSIPAIRRSLETLAPTLLRQLSLSGGLVGTDVIGGLTRVSEVDAEGWAMRLSNPEDAVRVGITAEGLPLRAVLASSFRRDLQVRLQTSGEHAFKVAFTLPGELRGKGAIQFALVDADTGRLIGAKEVLAVGADAPFPLAAAVAYPARPAPPSSDGADRLVHVLADVRDAEPAEVDRFLASVRAQSHSRWTLHLLGGAEDEHGDSRIEVVSRGLAEAEKQIAESVPETDLVLFADARLELAPEALAWFAYAADLEGAELVYADEERPGEDGSLRPILRHAFDLDQLLAADYVGPYYAIRARNLAGRSPHAAAFSARQFERLLEFAERSAGRGVLHLPVAIGRVHGTAPVSDRAEIVARHLERTVPGARVSPQVDPVAGAIDGALHVAWPLDKPNAHLAVIIPTKDNPALVSRCLATLAASAANLDATEIVLVDNQSTKVGADFYETELARFPRARLVRYDHPFNWSAVNNFAVRATDAEQLLFLNDDTESLTKDWDGILRRLLERREIGVVGARLLYVNRTLQHAGLILGQGQNPMHEAFGDLPTDGLYRDRTRLPHAAAAVTGAFLACRRETFEAVGGFDEDNFPISFNDVDFCICVGERGLTNLYWPELTFLHVESVSRGVDTYNFGREQRAYREAQAFRAKWPAHIENDVFYNPNFSGEGPPFTLLHRPSAETLAGHIRAQLARGGEVRADSSPVAGTFRIAEKSRASS